MFDFEKLDLYQELKQLNLMVYQTIPGLKDLDSYVIDQWKRASLSSVLNLAEGTGKMTPNDKKHYYTIARGSVFECVAILEMAHRLGHIDESLFDIFYAGYEKVSKMLLGMYRSQN
ncbi:MAG: four helix bundle protein [Bacteroidota bacterium]|nr:four helix bundle protein [Bacteroidota bacterium]